MAETRPAPFDGQSRTGYLGHLSMYEQRNRDRITLPPVWSAEYGERNITYDKKTRGLYADETLLNPERVITVAEGS